MDLTAEIAKKVAELPSELQEQVLRFATSLSRTRVGEKGSTLLPFASSLDPVSAQEMAQAIGEECERIETAE